MEELSLRALDLFGFGFDFDFFVFPDLCFPLGLETGETDRQTHRETDTQRQTDIQNTQ